MVDETMIAFNSYFGLDFKEGEIFSQGINVSKEGSSLAEELPERTINHVKTSLNVDSSMICKLLFVGCILGIFSAVILLINDVRTGPISSNGSTENRSESILKTILSIKPIKTG